jgi:hypothetical protein
MYLLPEILNVDCFYFMVICSVIKSELLRVKLNIMIGDMVKTHKRQSPMQDSIT